MEWQKAKNLIISLLLIINLCLGGLLYLKNGNEYNLSKKQQDAINTFLATNNIQFNSALIKSFKPRKKIILSPVELDNEALVDTFFKTTDVMQSVEVGQNLFRNESGNLYVGNNSFHYLSTSQVSGAISELDAKKLCEEIISTLGKEFAKYKFDKFFISEDEQLILYYRDNFDNAIINSNYIRFVTNRSGVQEATCEFFKAVAYEDANPKKIYSSDEAILKVIKEFGTYDDVAEDYVTENIIIESIELVYSLEYELSENYAVPCYRIYTSLTNSPEDPILVNAYYLELL